MLRSFDLKKNVINIGLGAFVVTFAACSFVSLNPQAENTTVLPKGSSYANCKFLGNTNVSIWSKATTFQSQEKAESQLDTLARNEAASMGGNTVTPTSDIVNGQRTYGVYNCPIK